MRNLDLDIKIGQAKLDENNETVKHFFPKSPKVEKDVIQVLLHCHLNSIGIIIAKINV